MTVYYVPPISDAMKFNGPAPEAVNGRLAMIGFVAGAITEFQTGVPLEQQALTSGPPTFVIAALIVYASLVPILKAAKSEPFGADFLCSEPLVSAPAFCYLNSFISCNYDCIPAVRGGEIGPFVGECSKWQQRNNSSIAMTLFNPKDYTRCTQSHAYLPYSHI